MKKQYSHLKAEERDLIAVKYAAKIKPQKVQILVKLQRSKLNMFRIKLIIDQ